MYKKEYFEYEVEIDEKATSDWYAQSKGWACECGHCRTPGCGVQSWGEVRCCHEPYPHGARGFAAPHFDLEFWVTLPWVLEEDIHGRS